MGEKAPEAFRTISEVASDLDLPQHVLRFWETRFAQIKPMKRGGGRRYYRPDDVDLLRGIRHLLYGEGYTIKGVKRILKERGVRFVMESWRQDVPMLPPVEPTEPARPAQSAPATPRPTQATPVIGHPPMDPGPIDVAAAQTSANSVAAAGEGGPHVGKLHPTGGQVPTHPPESLAASEPNALQAAPQIDGGASAQVRLSDTHAQSLAQQNPTQANPAQPSPTQANPKQANPKQAVAPASASSATLASPVREAAPSQAATHSDQRGTALSMSAEEEMVRRQMSLLGDPSVTAPPDPLPATRVDAQSHQVGMAPHGRLGAPAASAVPPVSTAATGHDATGQSGAHIATGRHTDAHLNHPSNSAEASMPPASGHNPVNPAGMTPDWAPQLTPEGVTEGAPEPLPQFDAVREASMSHRGGAVSPRPDVPNDHNSAVAGHSTSYAGTISVQDAIDPSFSKGMPQRPEPNSPSDAHDPKYMPTGMTSGGHPYAPRYAGLPEPSQSSPLTPPTRAREKLEAVLYALSECKRILLESVRNGDEWK